MTLKKTQEGCLASNIVSREQCCVPAHPSHRDPELDSLLAQMNTFLIAFK